MGLTSVSTQIGVIFSSFLCLVVFHWYLLYHCKSKWITSIPTKSICLFNASIFAFICGFGGLYVWYHPSDEQVMNALHGTNLLQEYICLIGVGYFIYDILIVLFIDPSIAYLIHALLGMIFGYLGGVIPLASHSGSFVMAYEISTPFKNLRYLLIKWGYSKSILFRVSEMIFIASFFYLRLIIGLRAMYDVTDGFLEELHSLHEKIVQSNATNNINEYTFRLYGTYFLLYGGWCNVLLNVYWSYAIFKAIIVFSKSRGDYTPDDENEIVYQHNTNICGDIDIDEMDDAEMHQTDTSLISAADTGDTLYFGQLYFRNAPSDPDPAVAAHAPMNDANTIHIDVYQHNMSTTYYKCDIGAILMNLNHNRTPHKQWFKYLLRWDRGSHFGDVTKPLIYSVKALLRFYCDKPLVATADIDTTSDYYHCQSLIAMKYGNIYLLTLLKTFGFGWNPISVYYCFDESNTKLICILFEMVNVPWSKRHVYVLPIHQFARYDEQQKQWMIEFMKICPFSPCDDTYGLDGKPKGYQITVNNPLNIKQNHGVLLCHGHVFSFMNCKDAHSQNKSKLIYHHKWGTSSCIIPMRNKMKENINGDCSQSPLIEFGLNKCSQSPLNSLNLLYLFIWYPFTSFVLRFQLYLFIIVNSCKYGLWPWLCNTKQNKSQQYFKKRLSYAEMFAELFKIGIGAMCFVFKTIWNMVQECRETMEQKQSNS